MFSHKKDKNALKKDVYLALNTTPAPTPTATPAPTPRPAMEAPARPIQVTHLSYENYVKALVLNDVTFVKQHVTTANVNHIFNGSSLLWLATDYGCEEIVKYLLSLNPISFKNLKENDTTPLHIAAKKGLVPIMRLLLDAGAEVDARSSLLETPLHKAIRNRHEEAVTLLLARGANVDARNDIGATPVSMLVDCNYEIDGTGAIRRNEDTIVRIFKVLIKNDANLDSEYPDCNQNFFPLKALIRGCKRFQMMEILDGVEKAKRVNPQILMHKIDELQDELIKMKAKVHKLERGLQHEPAEEKRGYNPFN